MQKELSDMQKWDMKSFTISDFDSFSDEKDVIVTTYTVKVEGTFDGKDASGTYNSGSVWKKEKGKWLAIFHTNMKEETAAKPAGIGIVPVSLASTRINVALSSDCSWCRRDMRSRLPRSQRDVPDN